MPSRPSRIIRQYAARFGGAGEAARHADDRDRLARLANVGRLGAGEAAASVRPPPPRSARSLAAARGDCLSRCCRSRVRWSLGERGLSSPRRSRSAMHAPLHRKTPAEPPFAGRPPRGEPSSACPLGDVIGLASAVPPHPDRRSGGKPRLDALLDLFDGLPGATRRSTPRPPSSTATHWAPSWKSGATSPPVAIASQQVVHAVHETVLVAQDVPRRPPGSDVRVRSARSPGSCGSPGALRRVVMPSRTRGRSCPRSSKRGIRGCRSPRSGCSSCGRSPCASLRTCRWRRRPKRARNDRRVVDGDLAHAAAAPLGAAGADAGAEPSG